VLRIHDLCHGVRNKGAFTALFNLDSETKNGYSTITRSGDTAYLAEYRLLLLARPRLRPARGIRQFGSAERGAAGFSGLANGGTEILMRDKCLGALSILRLLFHWRVPAEVTPIKIE
jgi:hypothetical protein